LHYLVQALWQCKCTGEPFCDISALMGTEFRTYRIFANEGLVSKLIDRGRDFWYKYVVTKTPPPVDASDGARTMLKSLYPQSGGEPVQSTPELEEMADSLLRARQAVTAAEKEKQLWENKIKSELQDSRAAYGNGWKIRYGTTKKGVRPFVFDHEREE